MEDAGVNVSAVFLSISPGASLRLELREADMAETRMKLQGDELARRAAALPEWRVNGDRLLRTFLFPDFREALAFVNRAGGVAEEMGHHPDIHLTWGRADVETSTHDAGGITASDFDLASKIDEQYFRR